MARANLTISEELRDSFEAACVSGNTRALKAEIQGEIITVANDPIILMSGTPEEDFSALSKNKFSPMYYLWNAGGEDGWVLVAYVNEMTCKVRDKMLYASCHKDLVQKLGASLFKGQFYCNSPDDFVYEGVRDALRSSSIGAPLSEAEVARDAEEKASIGQGVSQAGMSSLPFQLTSQATEKLMELNSGVGINFVELQVTESEAVDLCAAKTVASGAEIAASLDKENGRFYALRYPVAVDGHLFFVLSCPDSTPVKQRMILATVKSTVLEACKTAGLSFLKMMEVQDVEDIETDLMFEIKASTEDRSLKNDVAFSKPKGPPGRKGRRRMMKK